MHHKNSKALEAGLDAVSALEARLASPKPNPRTHGLKTSRQNSIQEDI